MFFIDVFWKIIGKNLEKREYLLKKLVVKAYFY